MQKNTLALFLLLAGSIFLFAPIKMVNAIPEDQVDAPLPPSDKKYDMSCVMNYECIDVYDMANYAETEKFCMDNYCNDPVKEDCGYNSFPCSAPIEYGCIKNGVCTTIQAMRDNDMYYAKGKCRLTCGAVKAGKSCITEAVEACPAPIIEKPDPLAGASVEALKGLANKNANKGNFSSPVVLINRAIKMLMAFIGSIALVLYIYSGFMWMTASGNAERVTKAKTTMVWTTLGVLMMLASYMLASFLFSNLPTGKTGGVSTPIAGQPCEDKDNRVLDSSGACVTKCEYRYPKTSGYGLCIEKSVCDGYDPALFKSETDLCPISDTTKACCHSI